MSADIGLVQDIVSLGWAFSYITRGSVYFCWMELLWMEFSCLISAGWNY